MNPLSIFKPEKKSAESTNVGSKFYVGIKEPFHIYMEIFEDEVIVTVFREHQVVLAYFGTLKQCLQQIKETINPLAYEFTSRDF